MQGQFAVHSPASAETIESRQEVINRAFARDDYLGGGERRKSVLSARVNGCPFSDGARLSIPQFVCFQGIRENHLTGITLQSVRGSWEIALFVVFVTIGVLNRKRPRIHRPMMLSPAW